MNLRKDGLPAPIDELLLENTAKAGYEPKKEIAAETDHPHFPDQDDDILDFFDFVF